MECSYRYELIDPFNGASNGCDNFIVIHVSAMSPGSYDEREPTGPRGMASPHEGTRRSNEFSGSCYCRIFGFKVIIIVHIEIFTLVHIITGVTDRIKGGRGGERYYHAGQIGFRVKSGVCACW